MSKFNDPIKSSVNKDTHQRSLPEGTFYAIVVTVSENDVIEYQPIDADDKRYVDELQQAYPLQKNLLNSPIPKELVLIDTRYPGRTFYVSNLNINNTVNNNFESYFLQTVNTRDLVEDTQIEQYTTSLSGLPNAPDDPTIEIQEFLTSNDIKDVRSKIGDVKTQGRFGNSIVYSYHIEGDSDPEPIVYISNEHDNTDDTEPYINPETNDIKSQVVLSPESRVIELQTQLNPFIKDNGMFEDAKKEMGELKGPQIHVRSGRILFDAYDKDIIGNSKRVTFFNSNQMFGASTRNISMFALQDTLIRSSRALVLKQRDTLIENTGSMTAETDGTTVFKSGRIRLNTRNLLFNNLNWLAFFGQFLQRLSTVSSIGQVAAIGAEFNGRFKAQTGI